MCLRFFVLFTFKVYCWNEAHGCDSKGPVEVMLGHYEKECVFHTSECVRCGERVLHSELSTHSLPDRMRHRCPYSGHRGRNLGV
ncbi:hypothetical protein MRX96_017079 [Rhipicephalus microplus]